MPYINKERKTDREREREIVCLPNTLFEYQQNWIKVLNVRNRATKILEENVTQKFQTKDFKRFIRYDTKNTNYKTHKFDYIKI